VFRGEGGLTLCDTSIQKKKFCGGRGGLKISFLAWRHLWMTPKTKWNINKISFFAANVIFEMNYCGNPIKCSEVSYAVALSLKIHRLMAVNVHCTYATLLPFLFVPKRWTFKILMTVINECKFLLATWQVLFCAC